MNNPSHVNVNTRAALAQTFKTAYIKFEVYERETTRNLITGDVAHVEVIALVDGKLAGFYTGKNFDEAKGAAWEDICNERGLNINDGSPDYDRYIAHRERQHHAALDAQEDEQSRDMYAVYRDYDSLT